MLHFHPRRRRHTPLQTSGCRRPLLNTGRCAQGEVEVTVLFAPAREDAYAAMAWCQMEGRAARLPLALQGVGLGPQVGQPI